MQPRDTQVDSVSPGETLTIWLERLNSPTFRTSFPCPAQAMVARPGLHSTFGSIPHESATFPGGRFESPVPCRAARPHHALGDAPTAFPLDGTSPLGYTKGPEVRLPGPSGEMVDAGDSKSPALRRVGSSPTLGTNLFSLAPEPSQAGACSAVSLPASRGTPTTAAARRRGSGRAPKPQADRRSAPRGRARPASPPRDPRRP